MVLRAKIDMASPNMHFRDPLMYRIITIHPHHRTGWRWKAYPMYDYAHGQSDYFEGVTHSFVLWSLKYIAHFTTGLSISLKHQIIVRARLNSTV